MSKSKQLNDIRKLYGNLFLIRSIFTRLISKEKYKRIIFSRLSKDNKDLITKYESAKYESSMNEKKIFIWTFWWQGEDTAPTVVKKCLNSIRKNFSSEKYEVVVLDKQNITSFYHFPDVIFDKLSRGLITLTHFSDILRAFLLRNYGGLWIDATVYVTKPVPTDYFDRFSIFTVINEHSSRLINGRWTGFLFYSKKGYPLFEFMDDFFVQYWKKNDYLADYLLIDFVIAIFAEHNKFFEQDYNKIALSNPFIWHYLRKLNQPFSMDEWRNSCEDTYFFKLSYKEEFNNGQLQITNNGLSTNWKHILNESEQ